jgi:PleD family two-component response regulator
LARALDPSRYTTVDIASGTIALEWAPDVRPDAIILDADLPDMSGIDVCRQLHADLRVGLSVPILIVESDKPTPEQRVAGLRAGAWDFLRFPSDPSDVSLTLETCVQAKRNLEDPSQGEVEGPSGLLGRPGLARRVRQLGALMARKHGSLSCVLFALDEPDPKAGARLASVARRSDVVGSLSPTELAVLAPNTSEAGAVTLARRLSDVLGTRQVGYAAAENLRYSPMDPVSLLAQASAAVRTGQPDPNYPWVRRFQAGPGMPRTSGESNGPVPVGEPDLERRAS